MDALVPLLHFGLGLLYGIALGHYVIPATVDWLNDRRRHRGR